MHMLPSCSYVTIAGAVTYPCKLKQDAVSVSAIKERMCVENTRHLELVNVDDKSRAYLSAFLV